MVKSFNLTAIVEQKMTSINANSLSLLSTTCLFLHCFTIIIAAIKAQSSPQPNNRVINLPGQPPEPSISQFSGYITVNEDHGRALFYWFFEAQTLPEDKPLLLWLNGGPGCSSIGYGAASELGPLRVSTNGSGLLFNKYAWNQEANLLFVESPVGVGFSYTNATSDLSIIDDVFVAEDAYSFIVNWVKEYPQFKAHDFFIAGESYAGHYVPQLAELIHDRNMETSINLKGFIVGNPETDDYYDNKGLLEYAWSHSVISDQQYEKTKAACDFKVPDWSPQCTEAMSAVYGTYREIDIYNIYAPSCLANTATTSPFKSLEKVNNLAGRKRMRIRGGYDPCYSNYARDYFNRADVQESLHAAMGNNQTLKWEVCSDPIFRAYNYNVSSVLEIYTKLIKGGLRIWIYSGDTDGRVPVIGSRYWIQALGLPLFSPWRSWYHDHQVGGRIMEYDGLTFVTVRGAGHLVPLNKPQEALFLLHSFLTAQSLPSNRY